MLINKNSVTKSVNVDCPLGISEIKNESVSIYPNPAGNQITVNSSLRSMKQSFELTIYDLFGKKVLTTIVKENEQTIDISKLSKGVYTIKIKTNDGVIVKELIKQ